MQGMIFIDQLLKLIVFLTFYFYSSQAAVSNNKFRMGGSERAHFGFCTLKFPLRVKIACSYNDVVHVPLSVL